MTTRKHPHDGPEQEGQATPLSPVEARLEARIAQQREGASVQRLEKAAETEAALAEARDRHLRLAADFDNYKKRSRQEQLETIQHASAELINRLLPVLDDLHNVLDHRPKGIDESWLKGNELSVRHPQDAPRT